MVKALRKSAYQFLSMDYDSLKSLLERGESLKQSLASCEQSGNPIDMELLPIDELDKSGVRMIHARIHIRCNSQHLFCNAFFSRSGTAMLDRDIYTFVGSQKPQKTGYQV